VVVATTTRASKTSTSQPPASQPPSLVDFPAVTAAAANRTESQRRRSRWGSRLAARRLLLQPKRPAATLVGRTNRGQAVSLPPSLHFSPPLSFSKRARALASAQLSLSRALQYSPWIERGLSPLLFCSLARGRDRGEAAPVRVERPTGEHGARMTPTTTT